ncbi:MAG: cupin domain-containing protein [Pseudomonadales bacterium]|nr:cupin domain-containing protein [Pseudomonadales bacterium]
MVGDNNSSKDWLVFDPEELAGRVAGNEARIFEFLRVPTLSVSIYRLPAGSKDMQAPHMEDEVYYVIEGKARLRVEDKNHDIRPGSVLYVRATAAHSFFDIEEDLVVLAIFGKA